MSKSKGFNLRYYALRSAYRIHSWNVFVLSDGSRTKTNPRWEKRWRMYVLQATISCKPYTANKILGESHILAMEDSVYNFIYSFTFLTFYGYITNSQCNQLPDGLMAQLVEHCTGVAEDRNSEENSAKFSPK